MLTVRKHVVAIYVDRSSGQWIAEETELELVRGHYKYMLGLPP